MDKLGLNFSMRSRNNFFRVRVCFFVTMMMTATSLFCQSIFTAPFRLVNSADNEQAPVISPDGRTLFLTIAGRAENVGGKKDLGDIWISVWANGEWSSPVHGGSEINNEAYNAVLGFSRDGSRMFLAGHYASKGLITTQGFSVSTKSEYAWSFPENVTIPYFRNKADKLDGTITPDESVFIFSAESYNTKGVEDIYVSLKKDGKWAEPINLGVAINTPLQEFSPYITEDGKTLYFSSNGKGGFGGFDIFTASRLDDSWTVWSTPLNMAEPLNSEARELYYRNFPDQKISLFTTTRNSNGYGNVYGWGDTLKMPAPRIDTLVKIREVRHDEEAGRNKFVIVSGRVVNSKTGAGLAAKIDFKSDSVYTVSSGNDGYFKIQIPSTKIYSIEVKARNFVNLSERLDIHTFELKTLEMSFKLQPIEVGAVVNLKSVLFYMGTTSLLEESYPELDVIVDFLKNNPKVEIQLEGHTDNRGDAKKNLILSQQRVDRIKTYLTSKGIGPRRIKGKGFGGSKPIATNDSEEARKLNRRVEFVIVKD